MRNFEKISGDEPPDPLLNWDVPDPQANTGLSIS